MTLPQQTYFCFINIILIYLLVFKLLKADKVKQHILIFSTKFGLGVVKTFGKRDFKNSCRQVQGIFLTSYFHCLISVEIMLSTKLNLNFNCSKFRQKCVELNWNFTYT